jgi:hypothetical protein
MTYDPSFVPTLKILEGKTTVSAVKYKNHVYDSVGDMIHGNGYSRTEIYVPEFNLLIHELGCYFLDNDKLPYKRTNPVTNIVLTAELLEAFLRVAKLRKAADDLFKEGYAVLNETEHLSERSYEDTSEDPFAGDEDDA